jgi:hypothetical protein
LFDQQKSRAGLMRRASCQEADNEQSHCGHGTTTQGSAPSLEGCAASHAALSKPLGAALGELRAGVRSRAKLAAVQALSAKRQ